MWIWLSLNFSFYSWFLPLANISTNYGFFVTSEVYLFCQTKQTDLLPFQKHQTVYLPYSSKLQNQQKNKMVYILYDENVCGNKLIKYKTKRRPVWFVLELNVFVD